MLNVTYNFDTAPEVFGINPTGFTNEINPAGFWHYRVWHSQNDGNPYMGIPPNKYGRFNLRARIAFTSGRYNPDITFFGFMTNIPPDNVSLANAGSGWGFFHHGDEGFHGLAPGWFHNGAFGFSFGNAGEWINWAPYNNNGYRDLVVEVQPNKAIKLSVEGLTAVSSIASFDPENVEWPYIVGGPIGTGVGGSNDTSYWFDMSADTLSLMYDPPSIWDGSNSPMVMG